MNDCNNVQKGDAVAVISHGFNWHIERRVVERTTPTMVVVGGASYNRRGMRRGDSSYRSPRIEPWTDEHDEMLIVQSANNARLKSVRLIREYDWREAKGEDVAAVIALMQQRGMMPHD